MSGVRCGYRSRGSAAEPTVKKATPAQQRGVRRARTAQSDLLWSACRVIGYRKRTRRITRASGCKCHTDVAAGQRWQTAYAIIRLSEAASGRNARARLAFGRGQLSRMIFSISIHHGRSEPMMFTWVRLPAWGVGKAPKAQPPRTEPPLISTSGGSAPPALS